MEQEKLFDRSAGALIEYCRTHGLTVATAESCTGGLIASLLTDVPGSSAVVMGGCVAYTNEVKQAVLRVPASVISEHTEVSAPCAAAMAEGARRLMGASLAVSTTGYAGPGGGNEKNPVGTVYLAIASRTGTVTKRFEAPVGSSRTEVKRLAALFAISLLLESARENESRP